MIEFKKFRSPKDPIRIVSITGHSAIITSELRPLPSHLWADAYAAGAVSEDMKDESMSDFVEKKKQEALSAIVRERMETKEKLMEAYNNPNSFLNKNGSLIHRKVIALLGKPIKKDEIDSIWKEILEEQKNT